MEVDPSNLRVKPWPGNKSAVGDLLGLLSAGENSAEAAFGRIARRLPPAATQLVSQTLNAIRIDERRHGQLLVNAASIAGINPQRPLNIARRFFAVLESRDLGVHIARIAALDACVCQVLARVLGVTPSVRLPPSIVLVLESIRRDEGRHVRAARRLVEEFSIDASANRSIELETRYAFDAVLGGYDMAFAALNVDVNAMRCQIRRDNS